MDSVRSVPYVPRGFDLTHSQADPLARPLATPYRSKPTRGRVGAILRTMARIRSIKPDFFEDEKLGELSLRARLLFIATWVFADDVGNFRANLKKLGGQAFAYDGVKISQVQKAMAELVDGGFVQLYKIGGEQFGHVPNFARHQKINRPSAWRLPPPTEDSLSPPGALRQGEGKREVEGKGEGKREVEGKGEGKTVGPVARRSGKVEYSEDFEKFWAWWRKPIHHPQGAGPGEKKEAWGKWPSGVDPREIALAAQNYLRDHLASDQKTRHLVRWLPNWEDWRDREPRKATPQGGGTLDRLHRRRALMEEQENEANGRIEAGGEAVLGLPSEPV